MIDSISKINSNNLLVNSINKPTSNEYIDKLSPKDQLSINSYLNSPNETVDNFEGIIQMTNDYKLMLSSKSIESYNNFINNNNLTNYQTDFLNEVEDKFSFNDNPYTAAANKMIERYEEEGDENFLQSAISFYEKANENGKLSDQDTYENIAKIYEKLDDPTKAKEYYNKVLEIDENNQDALSSLVNISTDEGNLEEAATYVSKLEENEYLSAESKNSLGNYYLETDDTDKAREYFYDVVSNDNTNIDGIIGLSYVNMKEGNLDEANEYLKAALILDPTNENIFKAFEDLRSY